MLWQAIKAARDLGRVHDIAAVLIRYGFGDLVRRIGMAGALERAGRSLHWRVPADLAVLEPAARVARALEELGPTFIKLGQMLATRVDLLPPEWIAEFEKLQDSVPAVPFDEIRAQLEEDLGDAPEAVFDALDTEPLAAASLAQVYRARLADGRAVVLKVRRPGIRPVVEADLRLLTRLADIIEAEAPDLRRYHLREVVRQLTLSLRREMDFAAECRSAERIAACFAGPGDGAGSRSDHHVVADEAGLSAADEVVPESAEARPDARGDIVIPHIHWQWTCERLNVQECIVGIPGRRVAELDAAGLDRRVLARKGAAAVLKMMLEDGFFHADPHPGNVIYLPGNRIAFIDFGMVGRLSEERRYQVATLLQGLVGRDAEAAAEVLLDWGGGSEVDAATLRGEIDAFIDQYHGVPLKSLRLADMLSDLMAMLRDHSLSLPPDLTLMVKAFVTLEGMGRQLDPEFDMAGAARPFLERVMLAHHSPEALARRGWRSVLGAVDLVTGLPRDLRSLLRSVRRGTFQVQVEVLPLRQFGDQIDRAFSRLTLGIVTAALIVASALVMGLAHDEASGIPFFALLGFIAAVLGGLAVLISIWRGGKG
ncbi:MAG: ABC1 kinase family protein [Rhodocyclaceae bacterium]